MKGVRRTAKKAGTWYAGDQESLLKQIEDCITHEIGPGSKPEQKDEPGSILGLVSPHAGYAYSGPVAAHGMVALAEDRAYVDTFVILGPNHSGWGAPVSIFPKGSWETPLGTCKINDRLIEMIQNFKLPDRLRRVVRIETDAHSQEHSIELQLPFLQYAFDDFEILPICMGDQSIETCKELAEILSRIIREEDLENHVVIVGSTDFTHFESQSMASKRDKLVIERILDLDPEGADAIRSKEVISQCGYGPVNTMLYVCKELGATEADLLKYSTSGDITNDTSSVVGYASIKIQRSKK